MRVSSKTTCNSTLPQTCLIRFSLSYHSKIRHFFHTHKRGVLYTQIAFFSRTCPPIPSDTSKRLIPQTFRLFSFNERRLVEDDGDADHGKRKKKIMQIGKRVVKEGKLSERRRASSNALLVSFVIGSLSLLLFSYSSSPFVFADELLAQEAEMENESRADLPSN